MKTLSVSSTVYQVSDLDRTITFYESLGFGKTKREGDRAWVYLNWYSMELRAVPTASASGGQFAGIKVDDADQAREELSGNGLAVGEVEDRPDGGREFVLTDPDGHRLILFSKK